MKSYRKELWFNIPDRMGFSILPRRSGLLQESGIREGCAGECHAYHRFRFYQ